MYSKTYKATIKTITRSPLTWAAVALLIGVAIYSSMRGSYGKVDMSTYKMIWDTDPRFTIDYPLYIQHLRNALYTGSLMLYPAPVFCVIVSGVVLARDWHDNFFEIERAGGVKPRQYFISRFVAVLSFVSVITLITGFVAFHVYCLSRGGVESLSLWTYLFDSTVRILRIFFLAVFPGILIFVSFTFAVGSVFKNGIIGTLSGLALVVFKYLSQGILRFRLPDFYHKYLSPTPAYLYQFWGYYDTEWFFEKTQYNPFTTQQMLLCLFCLYLISSIFIILSYFSIKKRRV